MPAYVPSVETSFKFHPHSVNDRKFLLTHVLRIIYCHQSEATSTLQQDRDVVGSANRNYVYAKCK